MPLVPSNSTSTATDPGNLGENKQYNYVHIDN